MKINEILPTIAAATRIANETTKGASSHCADTRGSDFPSPGRRAELLDDYIRDKQQMARLLGVQPYHDKMMDEIKRLQSQNVEVGDRVMIIGGHPMARGLIGVVQRIDTSRQGRCYVTSGGKIYGVRMDELILQNVEVSQ